MPQFRKKPVVVEAVQYNLRDPLPPGVRGTSYEEVANGLGTSGCSKAPDCWDWKVMGVIDTLEGPLFVVPGDWIITGVKGEKYPCKPDIFEATYDPA